MRLATGSHFITAVSMLVICIGLVITGYNLLYWDGFAPASGFAPIWVGIAGILLSGLMLFGIGTGGFPDESSVPNRDEMYRVGATTLGLWLFVALAPVLGTLPTALLFMIFMLLGVLRRPLVPSAAAALATAALVYGIFVAWLKVPLPTGILGI
ncbi:tripartite tricarboxylate transporter TctB family protein [Mesorhizobium yinganensis]|uniref:tripartite tricarboxylate transporter TctB family protein n=1 Tax=Mesorhizobium yinganensis TaxID=3157707 RepID=UPI0032B7A841